MTELKVISRSFEETQEIGKFIGEKARPGDVYLLVGQLGAGKTCLTRGLLWGLGSGESARSPTFVIISHYVGYYSSSNHDSRYSYSTLSDIIITDYMSRTQVFTDIVIHARQSPENCSFSGP